MPPPPPAHDPLRAVSPSVSGPRIESAAPPPPPPEDEDEASGAAEGEGEGEGEETEEEESVMAELYECDQNTLPRTLADLEAARESIEKVRVSFFFPVGELHRER